jgi:hypothetical protein
VMSDLVAATRSGLLSSVVAPEPVTLPPPQGPR